MRSFVKHSQSTYISQFSQPTLKKQTTMKTTIIKTIALCAVCALAVGCDDYLDTTNERYTPAHDELTTLEALRATTASLYTSPWYYFHKRRFIQLGDARANNVLNSTTTSNDWNVQASLNEDIENTSITHAWGSLYNVVTQAGYVIDDYAPYCVSHGVCSQQEANQCIAEARFMRSLAYWFLAMYWHDVPIITNAVTASETAYANRFEDVLQFAICEAEYARKWLPVMPGDKGRVSKTSADVLLSRLYITAGAYAKGGHYSADFKASVLDSYYASDADYQAAQSLAEFYYAKAVAAATRAINEAPASGYGLMDDYEQIWRVQNNNNREVLFALQFVAGSTTSYGLGNDLQGDLCYSECLDNNYGKAWSTKASYDFVYVSTKRGGLSRTRGNIMPSGMTYDYLFHEYGYDDCVEANENESGQEKGTPWTVSTKNTTLGIKKHVVGGPIATDNIAFSGNSGLCTPMLRLAEAYLNLTEAYMGLYNMTETTDQRILEGVNTVRRRAYKMELADGTYPGDYGQTGVFNLDSLLQERRLETYMEGLFWPDIVRRSFMGGDHLQRMLDYQNNRIVDNEGDSIMGCYRLYNYKYSYNGQNPQKLGTVALATSYSTGQYTVYRKSKECVHNIPEGSFVHSTQLGEDDNLWSMVYPPVETNADPNLLKAPVAYDFTEIINNKSDYNEYE